jgi:hypothetical protein
MATVGHFTTMIGVFAFYITLLESTYEKKLVTQTYNLVPRFYNDYSLINLKKINELLVVNGRVSFPNKKIRTYIRKSFVV